MRSRNFERRPDRDIKILSVGISPQRTSPGGNDNDHAKREIPVSEYAQRAHDVLLVSSFAIWAMVLGFAPVMTYRLLVS